jgi:hypothetical protein
VRILPEGVVIQGIKPPEIKTDGKRRLKDFVSSFLDYTYQLESPIDYLRWAALCTIGGVAQRKVYMDEEHWFYHTNMYVVLTGDPGAKKSVAIRQSKRILKKVPGINLSSDAPSVVGLMDDFKDIANREHQSLNAFMLELSTLYENAKESIGGFLTALYDGDDDYLKRTRIGGKEHIPYPWLNLLAGTTPQQLSEIITRSSIGGGLVARTLYIFAEPSDPKTPRIKVTPALKKLFEDLVHDAAHISLLNGAFRLDANAGLWYDAWYMNKPGRYPRLPDVRTQSYYVRKPAHLMKLAMLVSLAYKDELVLTQSDFETALAFLEAMEPGLPRAFSSVGGNPFANDMDRMKAHIYACGKEGIGYGELYAANAAMIEKRFFDSNIEALVAMGDIVRALNIKAGEQYFWHEDYDPTKSLPLPASPARASGLVAAQATG